MSWCDDLSLVRNWQGWLGALALLGLLSLPSLMGDGPEDRAAYDRAAREIQAEARHGL